MCVSLVPNLMTELMEGPIEENEEKDSLVPDDRVYATLRRVRNSIRHLKRSEDLIIRFLASLPHSQEWMGYSTFEKYYVLNVLSYPEAQESLKSIDSAVSSKNAFRYSLPLDLFEGKVDTVHAFIPGLKNALKDNNVFEPLFNYILRLGGITSDAEAGTLLRVFTGYPVENANDRAKWETDYHILYYLVKHMFAAKGSYAKMKECIEITYPSDAERKTAERSPSSYADRVSGADASSILETLSRLSKVF